MAERYLEDFAVEQTFGSGGLRVEKERIKAFAAEFDPQPFHLDEEAARSFRQVTRLRPDDEEAFYQFGKAETRLAHYDEAATAFQKALELDPADTRVNDALDDAREGVKRIKEGKKHAEDQLKKQQANANGNVNANSSSRPPKRNPSKPW